MRLIGWAIALAAAGLTPAAMAQGPATPPATTPATSAPAQSAASTAATIPATGASQAVVYGTTGHMIPTSGIGEPDGRKGIQMQVTPIGEEASSFHNNWLLPLCAIISIIVLGLLLYAIVRFFADRRDLHLDALAAIGFADAGSRDHVAGRAVDDGLRRTGGRDGCCCARRGLGGRARRRRGCRRSCRSLGHRRWSKPGRGQGDRPSNQSHSLPR
jgi:hypothetical protein